MLHPSTPGEEDARSTPADLDLLLDQQTIQWRLLVIVALCLGVISMDGYDLGIAGSLAPAIAKNLSTSTASLLNVFALQTLGQAIGSFAISPLADRVGRRPVLVICLILFGLATLAIVATRAITQFGGMRFVTGMMGGALIPVTISLLADISPLRWRSTFVGIAYTGLWFGGLGVAAVMTWSLDRYGWRSAFLMGGAASLALALFVFWLVPESPRHLARKNRRNDEVLMTLRQLGIAVVSPKAGFLVKTQTARSAPVLELFGDGRAGMTMMLWVAAIFALTASTLVSFLPTFFHDLAAVPLPRFAAMLSLSLVASLLAAFTTGLAMDRLGQYPVMIGCAVLGALALSGLAIVPFKAPLFAANIAAVGFFCTATQQALNVLSPTLYPPQMRATAVGWKVGVSKLASAAAPLMGAAILSRSATLSTALLLCAAPLILLALCAPVLALSARRTADQRLT